MSTQKKTQQNTEVEKDDAAKRAGKRQKQEQPCLFCRSTGYLTWSDGALDSTAYCDCPAGDAAYHRDDDIMQVHKNRLDGSNDDE